MKWQMSEKRQQWHQQHNRSQAPYRMHMSEHPTQFDHQFDFNFNKKREREEDERYVGTLLDAFLLQADARITHHTRR